VLKRVLLVYNEAANRLETGKDLPPNVIPAAAKLLRQFIEQYHEKLEEDYGSIRLRSKRPARPPTGTHSEAGGPLSVFWTNLMPQWIKSPEIRANILHTILARGEWCCGVLHS
jgi:hypothetical protein